MTPTDQQICSGTYPHAYLYMIYSYINPPKLQCLGHDHLRFYAIFVRSPVTWNRDIHLWVNYCALSTAGHQQRAGVQSHRLKGNYFLHSRESNAGLARESDRDRLTTTLTLSTYMTLHN